MKKIIINITKIIFISLLTSCNQLTQYTINEEEINNYLHKHNRYEKQIGIPGILDAHIVLKELHSYIGRSDPGIITLSGNAKVSITSILGLQKVDLRLTMKTKPFYNQEKGAIFLKDMELIKYSAQPEKLQVIMNQLMPYLNQSLKYYFNEKPAYVLKSDKSIVATLTKIAVKSLEVKTGSLVIQFCN
ncbi:hypothetical protein SCc_453 [Serratia symbiotica str. 'Cinara cedri']|nr:hypothetical protein SCc_453 [Serratia symbiotica str. 'Cinara cedri']